MSVLPVSQGVVHDRVWLQNEKFERSLRHDEIAVARATRITDKVEIELDQFKLNTQKDIAQHELSKEKLCRFWSETTMLNRRSAS